MRKRSHLTARQRANVSRLTKLFHDAMLLRGSLVTMARTCGKPKCKCRRGNKHVSLYLSIRLGDKRKMIYIPTAWEQTVGSWVQAYQEAEQLIEDISQSCLRRFLEAKQSGRTPRP